MQENPFIDKVALITGASRRIGAEIAQELHRLGFRVLLHYRRTKNAAETLCAKLNQIRPDSAALLQADLRMMSALNTLVSDGVKQWGRLDALINNASCFYQTPFAKATESAWEDLFDTNLKAPFFLAQHAAPYLAEKKGVIINITDFHARRPLLDYSIYCLSKAGLDMLTKVLAKELGPDVRVNAVAPGPIEWPEGENSLSEAEKQKIISQTCLHRAGCAQDIATAVLYFVRDAQYVSAQTLTIDGGRTVR